jgi:hypothetical protein
MTEDSIKRCIEENDIDITFLHFENAKRKAERPH